MDQELPTPAPVPLTGDIAERKTPDAPPIGAEGLQEPPLEKKWLDLRVYGFKVGSLNFVIKQGLYSELLSQFQISVLPNAPSHCLGLVNIRGNLVPLYQLEPLLDLPSDKTVYAFLIGQPAAGAALMIENKPQALDLSELSPITIANDLPDILANAVTESYELDGEKWHALDHTKLFQQLSNPLLS